MPKNLKTCFLARYCLRDGEHEHHDHVLIHALNEATATTFATRLEHDTNCDTGCVVCSKPNDKPGRINVEHPFSFVDGMTAAELENLKPLTISQAKLLRNIFSFLEYNA